MDTIRNETLNVHEVRNNGKNEKKAAKSGIQQIAEARKGSEELENIIFQVF